MNDNIAAFWDYYIVTTMFRMETHRLDIRFGSLGLVLAWEYVGFGAVFLTFFGIVRMVANISSG